MGLTLAAEISNNEAWRNSNIVDATSRNGKLRGSSDWHLPIDRYTLIMTVNQR